MDKSSKPEPANTPSVADPWDTALIIGQTIGPVFPLDGKDPATGFGSWPSKAKDVRTGILELKKVWTGHNYGVVLGENAFSLDIDVTIEELADELAKLHHPDILGDFTLGFITVTGSGHFHAYFNQRGFKARNQKLTDKTYLRGYPNYYMVGPGSIHPDTGRPYSYCDKPGHDDPRHLGTISSEILERLSTERVVASDTPNDPIFFNLGPGDDVLLLPHPSCIQKLMMRGAPRDQEYAQANHTIARYAISAGLSDIDALAITEEMAKHTTGHTTHKSVEDRVYNFRSHLQSSRNKGDYWKCSYIWGSDEFMASGPVCNNCSYKHTAADADPDIDKRTRDEALRIMLNEDPLEYLILYYSKVHASDIVNGKYGFLQKAICNVLNSGGLQQEGSGGSGKGKTSSDRAVDHHLPPEDVLDSAFSNKALWRESLHPGMVICLDDAQISPDLEVVIRRSMSNFQHVTTYHTLDNKNESIVCKIPPRIIWKINQVDNSLDLQTENRMVRTSVDESTDADAKTHLMQKLRDLMGEVEYPITFETRVCREIFRILNEIGPFYVDIPWANDLIWPESRQGDRRGYPIFSDIIKAFAALRCLQRCTPSEGHIIAQREDFDSAVEFYTELGSSPTTKQNAREHRVVQAILDLQGINIEPTLKKLLPLVNKDAPEKYAPISEAELRRIIEGRDGRGGLLSKIPELSAEFRTVSVSSSVSKSGGYISETKNRRAKVYELTGYSFIGSYDTTDIRLPEGVSEGALFTNVYPLFTTPWLNNNDDAESLESPNDQVSSNISNCIIDVLPVYQELRTPPSEHTTLPDSEDENVGGGVHPESGKVAIVQLSTPQEVINDELPQIEGHNEDIDCLPPHGKQWKNMVNNEELSSCGKQHSLDNTEYKTAPKKQKRKKSKQGHKGTNFQKRIGPLVLPDVAPHMDSHTFMVGTDAVRLGDVVACDIETTGLLPALHRIRLISVYDGKHTITVEDPKAFAQLLADKFITKVFHNAAFDISFLEWSGYPVVNYQDTMLMVQVVEYTKHPGLEAAVDKYLGIRLDKSLQDAEYWEDELTEGHVLYNQQDAAATFRLYNFLLPKLNVELYNKELALVPITMRLRKDGIPFDVKGAQSHISELITQRDDLAAQIRADLRAPTLNFSAPEQIKDALLAIGIDIPRTNKQTLHWHSDNLTVKKLIEFKKLKTLIQQFETEYAPHVTPDGRLHASYWIIGSPVSRFSCSGPNLQKVPKALHGYFTSLNGEVFTNGDISQAQVRVLAELSQDPQLIADLNAGIDVFRKLAQEVFNVDDPTDEQRNIIKTTVYARFYGSPPSSIRGRIKREAAVLLSVERVEEIANSVLDPYPVAKEWLNDQLTADTISSFWGRSWNIPVDDNRRLNYSIQAGEAECMKEALTLLYPRLKPAWKLVNAVHDSVLIQSDKKDVEEVTQVLQECLTEGMSKLVTAVPVVVSVNSGTTWKAAEGK